MSLRLSAQEIEKAKFTFSIYDFDGLNTMDAYYIGPALRSLGLTPSLDRISQLGGTLVKQRVLSVQAFLAVYANAKKTKDMGTMDDFVECLRLNDKEGGGMISEEELGNILQAYGEKLDPEEVAEIIQDCGNPQDGFIAYVPFLQHLLDDLDLTPNTDDVDDTDMIDVTPIEPSVKSKSKLQRTISEDADTMPLDILGNPAENLSNAAFGLKTPKTRIPTVPEEPKPAEKAIAELAPKKQQAMIAIKTMAMIGSIK